MTSIQKVIKYLAIVFAIFLIITIISAILSVFYALSFWFGGNSNEQVNFNMIQDTINIANEDISRIDIDIISANLTIKTGNEFKIETSGNDFKINENNYKIEIQEKQFNWFKNKYNKEIIIYIPENIKFDAIEIDSGAGKIDIEKLITNKLELSLGAGQTTIDNLNVLQKSEIDGGAGEIQILNSKLNNLVLDMGVGKTILKSEITGNSEINAGIGELNVELKGKKDDYRIRATKGIGSIKIDDIDIVGDNIYGNGENNIDIDGGIGSIYINLE